MARIRQFDWSPNWYIIWAERQPDGRWRSRQLSTGARVEADAKRALAEFVAAQGRPPEQFTVNEVIDAYLAGMSERRWVRNREYEMRAVRNHFGLVPPSYIGPTLVRSFTKHRKAAGAANSTIDRQLRALRASLSWAMKNGWKFEVPYIETPGGGRARERWLVRNEAQELVGACEGHIRLFIVIALYTGARSGAILDLTWDRVDLERRLVMYPPAHPHSRKRTTIVPINDTLFDALSEAREFAVSDWVIEYRGRPVQSIKTGFRATVRRAGIAHCTPHDLRRTCATWMVQDGIQLEKVARYLGATKDMIEKVYGHHAPDYLRDAARALEG